MSAPAIESRFLSPRYKYVVVPHPTPGVNASGQISEAAREALARVRKSLAVISVLAKIACDEAPAWLGDDSGNGSNGR